MPGSNGSELSGRERRVVVRLVSRRRIWVVRLLMWDSVVERKVWVWRRRRRIWVARRVVGVSFGEGDWGSVSLDLGLESDFGVGGDGAGMVEELGSE